MTFSRTRSSRCLHDAQRPCQWQLCLPLPMQSADAICKQYLCLRTAPCMQDERPVRRSSSMIMFTHRSARRDAFMPSVTLARSAVVRSPSSSCSSRSMTMATSAPPKASESSIHSASVMTLSRFMLEQSMKNQVMIAQGLIALCHAVLRLLRSSMYCSQVQLALHNSACSPGFCTQFYALSGRGKQLVTAQ
jgi:hypothetical protein